VIDHTTGIGILVVNANRPSKQRITHSTSQQCNLTLLLYARRIGLGMGYKMGMKIIMGREGP
jgi:hypothetical protein